MKRALQITPLVNAMKRFDKFPEYARMEIFRELWDANPYVVKLLRDTITKILDEDVNGGRWGIR
jgi:hypothetical protein